MAILFNTSASQVGEYREKAQAALKSALAGLGPNDRVKLIAVDLNAVPLTKIFVAADSKEMADALAALDARVPLGATDMDKAMTGLASAFGGDSKNARAAIYIGDGGSKANLLGTETFAKLAEKLADARIPVSSYAIGARLDRQLLGALAAYTGGAVIVDQEGVTAEAVGQKLAAAANATVLWPTAATFPPEMTEVFPKHTPPLRSDRDTVVIGVFKGKAPQSVEMTVDGPKGPEKLVWAVAPSVSDDSNNYLTPLVERARVDGGVSMPLVDSSNLSDARQEINAGVRNLSQLARQALAAGNVAGAEQLVGEALRRDPNDPEAVAIQSALAKRAKSGAPEFRRRLPARPPWFRLRRPTLPAGLFRRRRRPSRPPGPPT